MGCFSHAYNDFGLTISLKKANVLGQDTEAPPVIIIDIYELNAVCQFTFLGSTIIDNHSLDAEIDKRIGKAASTLTRLTARVWTSPKLSVKTKMEVYNACVISSLLLLLLLACAITHQSHGQGTVLEPCPCHIVQLNESMAPLRRAGDGTAST